ncbi:MAG: type II secretion system F family protein [Desulfosporosinus sp.]|nr:type II secretion system F family protein [Desulfosporosinus sp.]
MDKLISLFACITVVITILSFQPRHKSIAQRLHKFTSWQPQLKEIPRGSSLEILASFIPDGWGKSRDIDLIRTNIPLNGNEFLVFQIVIASTLGSLGLFLMHKILVAVVLFILAWLMPLAYLSHAKNQQLKLFNSQLADALNLMANAIRSGFSFLQAMDMASREMPAPLSADWGSALKEMQLGVTIERALENLTARVGSADLDLMVTAILIQRQVGGNLSEVLSNIHNTIKDRLRIQKEIQTLTAQGRISGYLIAGLPFFIALMLLFINPNYLEVLISKPIGWEMIGGGLVSQTIGFVIIRRIVNIKV